jgi:hypothetical protein
MILSQNTTLASDRRNLASHERGKDRRTGYATAGRGAGENHGRFVPGALEGRMGPDIQVVPLPDPASHPAHEPREHFEAQVERLARGDFAVGGGGHDVTPALARLLAGRSKFSTNETIRAVPSSSTIPHTRGSGGRNRTMVSGSPCWR